MNVILAAIAGVMVQRVLMPPTLQTVSEWWPMGWALDGLQAVSLGDPDPVFIVSRAGLLVAFGVACLMVAWFVLRKPDES